MEDMDVSALFGNMLDNAIESAEKQREKQKRLIWLYVTKEKQFVRIRTENYCDEKIQFKNGMPVTTKKDRAPPSTINFSSISLFWHIMFRSKKFRSALRKRHFIILWRCSTRTTSCQKKILIW